MYSTPAVVTTSSSCVVYMTIGLPGVSSFRLLEVRTLIARIDEPEALDDLGLPVRLHLGEVDRQRGVVLLVYLHRSPRPLEDDRRQHRRYLVRVGALRLLDRHGVRIDAVVLGFGERVRCLEIGPELLLHRLEEGFVFGVVDAGEVVGG